MAPPKVAEITHNFTPELNLWSTHCTQHSIESHRYEVVPTSTVLPATGGPIQFTFKGTEYELISPEMLIDFKFRTTFANGKKLVTVIPVAGEKKIKSHEERTGLINCYGMTMWRSCDVLMNGQMISKPETTLPWTSCIYTHMNCSENSKNVYMDLAGYKEDPIDYSDEYDPMKPGSAGLYDRSKVLR